MSVVAEIFHWKLKDTEENNKLHQSLDPRLCASSCRSIQSSETAVWRRKLLLSTHRESVKSSPDARARSQIRGPLVWRFGSSAKRSSRLSQGARRGFSHHIQPEHWCSIVCEKWLTFHCFLYLSRSNRALATSKCYICRYHFSHLGKCVVSEQRRPKPSRDSKMINAPRTNSRPHLILFYCFTSSGEVRFHFLKSTRSF